jgi:hypothetical protein
MPVKLHVLASLPASTAPLLADQVWRSYQQQSADDGDLIPRLIAELEPLCRRWEPDLPPWRRAILAGRARRLTLHPPDSEWGKRMRRTKGGVRCQQKYREHGSHALAAFNQAMTKRRKATFDACEDGKQGSARTLSSVKEARKRLGITPGQMKDIERIAPILERAGCGPARALEALQYVREDDARRFLEKYHSIPVADRQHLTIDEICVAAGIDPMRLLTLAVEGMIWISSMMATIQAAQGSLDVMRVLVRSALTKRGWRDRRLFFDLCGVLADAPIQPHHSNK